MKATELLTSLREQPAVEFACLYDRQGKAFATYPAELPQGVVVRENRATGATPVRSPTPT
jgi:hypothetical protein